MNNNELQFLSTCWTSAGDVMPLRNGDLSDIPIERRVQAAAAAGFTGFGIGHSDIIAVRDGLGYRSFASMLVKHGIRDLELEYIDDWWLRGPRRAVSDKVRHDLLTAAAELGARHIKIGAGQAGDSYDDQFIREEFATLCDAAESAGTRVALEPAAFSAMATIRPAAAMVVDVAHRAGGLLIDIWHIYRSGTPYASLKDIVPAKSVFAVELNDGLEEPIGSLYEDTFDNRRYCGDGVFGVADFVKEMQSIGYTGPWGLEMMSTEYRKLTPEEGTREVIAAGRRCVLASAAEVSQL